MGVDSNIKDIRLEDIIARIKGMSILPSRLNGIIAITEDPDSTVQDLEKEIPGFNHAQVEDKIGELPLAISLRCHILSMC